MLCKSVEAEMLRHNLSTAFASSLHSVIMTELNENRAALQNFVKWDKTQNFITFITSEKLSESLDLLNILYQSAYEHYSKVSDDEMLNLTISK